MRMIAMISCIYAGLSASDESRRHPRIVTVAKCDRSASYFRTPRVATAARVQKVEESLSHAYDDQKEKDDKEEDDRTQSRCS
jgi:hypothetical protein